MARIVVGPEEITLCGPVGSAAVLVEKSHHIYIYIVISQNYSCDSLHFFDR